MLIENSLHQIHFPLLQLEHERATLFVCRNEKNLLIFRLLQDSSIIQCAIFRLTVYHASNEKWKNLMYNIDLIS